MAESGAGQLKILDTDVLSAIVKPNPPERLRSEIAAAKEICTTAISMGEILYGLEKFGSERLRRLYEERVFPLTVVLPFDEEAAKHYGRLRARLEAQGLPIGEADLMIASIAMAHDATLVTGNVAHFCRIPGLRLENWLK